MCDSPVVLFVLFNTQSLHDLAPEGAARWSFREQDNSK